LVKYCGILTFITADYLREVRCAALRKRTWYRALDRLERGIVNLSIKLVDAVRSDVLLGELVKILAKLRDAAKSAFTRHIEGYGVEKMWALVGQAVALGSGVALGWLSEGYAEWFAVNDYHNPVGWRSIV
jgi:hypothetical protein